MDDDDHHHGHCLHIITARNSFELTLVVPFHLRVGSNDGSNETSLSLVGLVVGLGTRSHDELVCLDCDLICLNYYVSAEKSREVSDSQTFWSLGGLVKSRLTKCVGG